MATTPNESDRLLWIMVEGAWLSLRFPATELEPFMKAAGLGVENEKRGPTDPWVTIKLDSGGYGRVRTSKIDAWQIRQ